MAEIDCAASFTKKKKKKSKCVLGSLSWISHRKITACSIHLWLCTFAPGKRLSGQKRRKSLERMVMFYIDSLTVMKFNSLPNFAGLQNSLFFLMLFVICHYLPAKHMHTSLLSKCERARNDKIKKDKVSEGHKQSAISFHCSLSVSLIRLFPLQRR